MHLTHSPLQAIGPLNKASIAFFNVQHGMTDTQMQDFVRDNTTPELRMKFLGFIEAIAAFRKEPHQQNAIKPLEEFGRILENAMLKGEKVEPFTGCATQ
jgi:hypothetical protein